MAIKAGHVLTFKVESGYDLVPRRKANTDANLYPFDQMSPGDSFEVRGIKNMERVRNAASKYQQEHAGVKFTSRTMGVDEEDIDPDTNKPTQVFRIWRVKDLVDARR